MNVKAVLKKIRSTFLQIADFNSCIKVIKF